MENNDKNMGGEVTAKAPLSARLDNFWYHYKWHTIAAVFALVVVIILAFQMCSKPSYDIHIMYAGPHELERTAVSGDIPEYNATVSALNRLCDDFNGDGTVSVNLLDLFVMTNQEMSDFAESNPDYEANTSLITQNKDTLYSNLLYSDYYLCFMSKTLFDEYETVENGAIFAPITPYTAADTTYEYASERGIYLRSLDIYSIPELSKLPDDTVVCIRGFSQISEMFGRDSGELQFQNSEILLKKLLAYKK